METLEQNNSSTEKKSTCYSFKITEAGKGMVEQACQDALKKGLAENKGDVLMFFATEYMRQHAEDRVPTRATAIADIKYYTDAIIDMYVAQAGETAIQADKARFAVKEEMEELQAQNRSLKKEVADLKAENERLKQAADIGRIVNIVVKENADLKSKLDRFMLTETDKTFLDGTSGTSPSATASDSTSVPRAEAEGAQVAIDVQSETKQRGRQATPALSASAPASASSSGDLTDAKKGGSGSIVTGSEGDSSAVEDSKSNRSQSVVGKKPELESPPTFIVEKSPQGGLMGEFMSAGEAPHSKMVGQKTDSLVADVRKCDTGRSMSSKTETKAETGPDTAQKKTGTGDGVGRETATKPKTDHGAGQVAEVAQQRLKAVNEKRGIKAG